MNVKIKDITSENGLPVEQVHVIDKDSKGKLWLATSAGLASYNASEVKVFDARTGIDCVGLRTVKFLFNSEIWIGTDKGIEVLDIDGNKIEFKINFEWTFGIAECIFQFNNYIYVGTSNGLLKISKQIDTYQLIKVYDFGFVRDIIKFDDTSILVVSAKENIVKVFEDKWKHFFNIQEENVTYTCLEKTIDGYYLIGSTKGLYVYNKSADLICHYNNSFNKNNVNSLYAKGSNWWIAFSDELLRVSFINEKINVKEHYNFDSIINDLFIDEIDNIWIATNNSGLKKISCLRKQIKTIDVGKKGAVYSVRKNQDNNFLISGDGFASNISLGKKKNSQLYFNSSIIVWDSCIDPLNKNRVFLATQDGLYVKEDHEEARKYDASNSKINVPCRVFAIVENTIWLGTIAGFFKIVNNTVLEVLNNKNNSFGYIYALTKTPDNNLWIGTLGQGLWYKKEADFVNIENPLLSSNGNTYSIALNNNNDVAFLQDSKLLVIDNQENITQIIEEHPIAGWSLTWLSETEIAIGSTYGITIVDVSLKTITNRINFYLGKSDWQFTFSPTIFLDNDTLYCGLNAGFYSVNLKKLKKYNSPPEPFLETMSWQNTTPKQEGDVYEVLTGKWSVNVSVYTPWYVDENQIQFRFKLVGFDTEWSELSSDFLVKYNSLPPGNYILQCQVFTNFTGFGEVKSLMKLVVSSPFWFSSFEPFLNRIQSNYSIFFKSKQSNQRLLKQNKELLVEVNTRKVIEQKLNDSKSQLEDVLFNYKASKEELLESNNSLRQLSSRLQNVLEEEKTAISREVHDVLGQKLTELKLDASWVDSKLDISEKEAKNKIKKMLLVIDETITLIRKIATDLRPSILDDLGLEAAIDWHARNFEKITEIKCSFVERELTEEYTDEIKTTIFRIFQESLTNIIRHAKASKVEVLLYEADKNLILEVKDNGIGISEERKKNITSLGLLGIKERVAILEGSFFIDNIKPKGTLVKVIIPFKK